MKIGELFIALGFQIKGQKDLEKVEKDVKRAAGEAAKLALAVNAVNFAILAMMDAAASAGAALRNFAVTTGLSTDDLQMWQHAAVVAGLSADEMTSAVKRLQAAQSSFLLGEPQAVGAWSLLGVNPLQDPFKVISDLRGRLAGTQPLVARALLARVGLENLAPLIQAPKSDFESWSRSFLVTREQIGELGKLNAAWGSLKTSIVSVRNVFAASLAPVFTTIARGLEWLASKVAILAQWLNKGGIVAKIVVGALAVGIVVLLGLGVALGVVTAALVALTAATAAFDLLAWLSGIPEIILAITIAVLGVGAAVAALVLLLDEMFESFAGNKSLTRDIGEWLAGFELVRRAIEAIWSAWDGLVRALELGADALGKAISKVPRWLIAGFGTGGLGDVAGEFALAQARRSSTTSNQENNIAVHVDGSRSPEATGRAVVRSLRDEIAAAAYQSPAAGF